MHLTPPPKTLWKRARYTLYFWGLLAIPLSLVLPMFWLPPSLILPTLTTASLLYWVITKNPIWDSRYQSFCDFYDSIGLFRHVVSFFTLVGLLVLAYQFATLAMTLIMLPLGLATLAVW